MQIFPPGYSFKQRWWWVKSNSKSQFSTENYLGNAAVPEDQKREITRNGNLDYGLATKKDF